MVTSSYDAPSVEIVQDPPLQFRAANRISLVAKVMHLRCTMQGEFLEIKEDTLPVLWRQALLTPISNNNADIALFSDGLVLTKQPNETFV